MIAFRFLPLAVLSLALSAAALADSPEPVEVGGWTVSQATEDSCQASAGFGDDFLVNIVEDSSGNGHFLFSDDRWKLEEGQLMAGLISWDGWENSEEIDFVVNAFPNDLSVLVADTDASFTENLAGSKRFWLQVPGVDFDDNFTVDEAPEVLAAVASCNSQL
jgi:hypothetical protein